MNNRGPSNTDAQGGGSPTQFCQIDPASDACTKAPFDAAQREQYIAWTQCGGGFVGVHQVQDA